MITAGIKRVSGKYITMEINDKSLEVLSAVLKIDKEILAKGLESGDIDLTDRVIFLKDEYETLEKNLKNQEYHKGKDAMFEMSLKEQKKKVADTYGIDTEGIKDFDTLFEKAITHKENEIKTTYKDSTTKDSEKILKQIEELKKNESLLRDKLKTTEETYEQKLSEKDLQFNDSLNNSEFMKVVNSIPFEVPKYVISEGKEAEMNFIKAEREKFLVMFKSKYKLDRIENKLIVKDGEEIIKNNLLEPEKIENIALNFAKTNYFNLTDKTVINFSDSKKFGNSFQSMSLEQFNELMEEQGIRASDTKYLEYYRKYKDANK